jgi:putative NADH-flavin reductase
VKLTIFAASRGTGRQVLDQAVAAGHDVTAVVRSPGSVPGNVRVIVADLSAPDPAALEAAVNGADAVLSGLGPRGKAEYGIASTGTRAIIEAMKATDVRRIVVVSVAGISTIPTPAGRTRRDATQASGSSRARCSARWRTPGSAGTTPTSR